MPTTSDDIRVASRLRAVFGRLGFDEERRFKRHRMAEHGLTPGILEERLFRFSDDGLRLLSVPLLDTRVAKR